MQKILNLAEVHNIQTISLPIFGVHHSRLEIVQSLDAMIQAITDHRSQAKVKIWLRTQNDQLRLVQQKLKAHTV
jgi:hypothetical protein